jgi:hypothetical protein
MFTFIFILEPCIVDNLFRQTILQVLFFLSLVNQNDQLVMKFNREQQKELRKIGSNFESLELLSEKIGFNLDDIVLTLNVPDVSEQQKTAVFKRNQSRQQVFELSRKAASKKEKSPIKVSARR